MTSYGRAPWLIVVFTFEQIYLIQTLKISLAMLISVDIVAPLCVFLQYMLLAVNYIYFFCFSMFHHSIYI